MTTDFRPPRVSVISIFYNAEPYFAEAIESVLGQDFDDFELILVDDGSTDSSSRLAQTYASNDPERICYVEHPGHQNRGMSATRNLGLSKARGEYIAFIDADDRWAPAKLGEQIAFLDANPDIDAIGGTVRYWASWNGGEDRLAPTGHVQLRPIAPPEAMLALYPLGDGVPPSMSDLLIRTSAIRAVGGFEAQFTGGYEDQIFLAKLYLHSTIYFSRSVWSDYRLHDQSCMAELHRQGRYREVRGDFLKWLNRYVADGPCRSSPLVRAAIDRSLFAARHPLLARSIAAAKAMTRRLARLVELSRQARSRTPAGPSEGPAILLYHRIADEPFDPWSLAVSPPRFAEQMEWLAESRTVLPLTEFARRHREGSLNSDAVAITFDDGYACNVHVAAPILQRLNLPATIFLPAEIIEQRRQFWWDKLQRIVIEHPQNETRLDGETITLGPSQPRDTQWVAGDPPRSVRQRAFLTLWDRLRTKTPEGLAAALEELAGGTDNGPDDPVKRPMTIDDARSVAPLIEFGSHALTHRSLPALNSADKAREIDESKLRCEAIADRPVASFAYPFGDADAESIGLVQSAGFECACITGERSVTSGSNVFALPRIGVGNFGAEGLARLLGDT